MEFVDVGVFEVVATNGDTNLGGEDFDNQLLEYFIDSFNNLYNGIVIRKHPKAL